MKKVRPGIPVILLLFVSCSKHDAGQGNTCTYSSDIKPIIAARCAIPSCHNAGSTLGDFTGYTALKERADNGRIRTNVFELKIMPPASAVPLTDAEKEKLKCWLDNGAPQD